MEITLILEADETLATNETDIVEDDSDRARNAANVEKSEGNESEEDAASPEDNQSGDESENSDVLEVITDESSTIKEAVEVSDDTRNAEKQT